MLRYVTADSEEVLRKRFDDVTSLDDLVRKVKKKLSSASNRNNTDISNDDQPALSFRDQQTGQWEDLDDDAAFSAAAQRAIQHTHTEVCATKQLTEIKRRLSGASALVP